MPHPGHGRPRGTAYRHLQGDRGNLLVGKTNWVQAIDRYWLLAWQKKTPGRAGRFGRPIHGWDWEVYAVVTAQSNCAPATSDRQQKIFYYQRRVNSYCLMPTNTPIAIEKTNWFARPH